MLSNEAAAPCLPPVCLRVGGQLRLLPGFGASKASVETQPPPTESRMGALAQLAPGTLREYIFHSILQVGHWVREVTGSRSTRTPDSPGFSLLGLAVSPAGTLHLRTSQIGLATWQASPRNRPAAETRCRQENKGAWGGPLWLPPLPPDTGFVGVLCLLPSQKPRCKKGHKASLQQPPSSLA